MFGRFYFPPLRAILPHLVAQPEAGLSANSQDYIMIILFHDEFTKLLGTLWFRHIWLRNLLKLKSQSYTQRSVVILDKHWNAALPSKSQNQLNMVPLATAISQTNIMFKDNTHYDMIFEYYSSPMGHVTYLNSLSILKSSRHLVFPGCPSRKAVYCFKTCLLLRKCSNLGLNYSSSSEEFIINSA